MQPRTDPAIQFQRVGPSSKDEENRLEGVVGIGSIPENSLAGAVHEGTVSANKTGERLFIAFGEKAAEKSRIGVARMRSRPAIK